MIKRVLCDLLDHARLLAIGNVMLVLAAKRQYRVRQKIFQRLRDQGWIERRQQSGDLCEYALTEAGRELAIRLKACEGKYTQLVLFELERTKKQDQRQAQEAQMSLF